MPLQVWETEVIIITTYLIFDLYVCDVDNLQSDFPLQSGQ